jgi:hypothetical protein
LVGRGAAEEEVTMIDVVHALELLEISADEMSSEDAGGGTCGTEGLPTRRASLTARALAKGQLTVADLSRFPLRRSQSGAGEDNEPPMTLGAVIVFRTADTFGRAGASTPRTLDAVYRAVQRYVDIIPITLQSCADRTAIRELMAEPPPSSRLALTLATAYLLATIRA